MQPRTIVPRHPVRRAVALPIESPHVRKLSALTPACLTRAGGKGASLARMISADVRVPDGFVVLCGTPTECPEVRSAISHLFDQFDFSRVAVRSSALCEDGTDSSCAGMFDTVLGVERAGLFNAIQKVLASAEAAGGRAGDMAVVVQRLIEPLCAGVCFSRNPVGSASEMVIEVVDGLGETLVSGEATPRRYHVSRESLEIREARATAAGGGLTSSQITEVAETSLRLERDSGTPVDVEWAICDGALHILQCRPITACADIDGDAGVSNDRYRYIWSTSEPMWMMELGVMTRAQRLPEDCVAPTLWTFEDLFYAKQGAVYEFHVSEADIVRFAPSVKGTVDLLDRADSAWLDQQRYFTKIGDLDFSRFDRAELAAFFDEASRFYCRYVGLYASSSSLVTRSFEQRLRQAVSLEEMLTLVRAPEPDLMEVEQNEWAAVVAAGEFSPAIALDHARKHPFVAINLDSEAAVVGVLKRLFDKARERDRSPASFERHKERLCDEQAAILGRHPELCETVSILHRMSSSRMRIKRGWAGLGFFMTRFFAELSRRSGVETSELLASYRPDELRRLIETGRTIDPETSAQRQIACIWQYRAGVLHFAQGDAAARRYAELVGEPEPGTLSGTVASAGTAVGVARMVNCNVPDSLRRARESFVDGDILVTEMAQPSMADLMARSAGVVTNEGGLLSHAAIVARELGIPCIVATRTATKTLRDGQMIELCASGAVVVLNSSATQRAVCGK